MKKLLILSIAVAALSVGLSACAETASGKVVKATGDTVTIRDANGVDHTMKTTSNTTYRKRISANHHKGSLHTTGTKNKSQPILTEDDYIEVIYSPSTDSEWIIEDVVIYEN